MTAEPTTERDLTEPMCWPLVEYPTSEGDTRYGVDTPAGRVHVPDQALAEDIAALPILKRELERLSGLVPVRRSEDNRLESVCQLLEELLAELKRGNAVERTGSVSSVQIEDYPTKDRPVRVTSKSYSGSPLPVDEAIEDHARLHREAEMRAAEGWSNTVDRLRSEFVS
jgi:hypothetical protein